VRVLLDEGLSPRLLEMLRAAGHDAVHVRDVGLRSAPDPVVLARAVDDQRVLVTLDTDFGALVAHSHATAPSLVLFRGQVTRRAERQAALLLANFDAVTDDLDAGAVVVIGDGRLRVRRLPIDG
jgi:predicted nuclease of predicted toxin-antitoxin system